ncbi:YecR family lipoprotein [Cupriavidus taiwanensis]
MLGAVAILTACASPKKLVATGGSRADGTVKMSYEYGLFETPQVNTLQGAATAKQRCAAWGYKEAEPFGGATKKCINSSSSGCNRWMVTIEYQCTGTPIASR